MSHSLNWHTLKLYAAALVTYIALDCAWICYLMKDFYTQNMRTFVSIADGHIAVINWPAAVLAWALIALGQVVFVFPRSHGDYTCALTKGALYGFIVVGVYQLSNYSVVRGWSPELVLYDIAWGMVANALVSVLVLYIANLCHYKHGEKCH